MEPSSRPGLALVGILAIAAGATIAVSAVVAAVAGDQPRAPATTSAAPRQREALEEPDTSAPQTVSDPSKWQLVATPDGSLSYEAPRQWTAAVDYSEGAGANRIAGTGRMATSFDTYLAATGEGIMVVATETTDATSAGLQGAVIGSGAAFCPLSGCTTGKITELPTQLPSSLKQVDSQYAVAPPGTGTLGELRYTIETSSPTRYVVLGVRTADPYQGEEILKHAAATLKLG